MYDKSPARGINFTLIKWIPQFWCEKIVKLYIMLINNIIRNGNVIEGFKKMKHSILEIDGAVITMVALLTCMSVKHKPILNI
ncbi:hypothetical protein H8356DRAFT_1351535 [Neocallimastix lanati (nom. inval.)]|nr:hypothetical protein H8356DRAFT_1351535 [Neocallimastix sp. JGI-2020a]